MLYCTFAIHPHPDNDLQRGLQVWGNQLNTEDLSANFITYIQGFERIEIKICRQRKSIIYIYIYIYIL